MSGLDPSPLATVLVEPGDLEPSNGDLGDSSDGAPRLDPGMAVRIEGDTYRHLFRSRRLAVGDALRMVDGRGEARLGKIESAEKRSARVILGKRIESGEVARSVHLVVGALRPERASWLVEKSTELGVRSLTFITTERTPREYGAGRLDRFRRVAIAALEQCHRSYLPEIRGVLPWQEAIEGRLTGQCLVLAPGAPGLSEPRAGVGLRLDGPAGKSPAADTYGEENEVCLWVGPEGGWSASELAQLEARGCRLVGLGPSILRVETAAVAATALLLFGS